MKQQELVISLYSPLTADFYPFEEDALGFRETAADAVLLDGRDLADYADSVRESVSARNAGIGNLMEYFDTEKEMHDRVCRSGNYSEALHIVSEYVETELTGSKPVKPKERGTER